MDTFNDFMSFIMALNQYNIYYPPNKNRKSNIILMYQISMVSFCHLFEKSFLIDIIKFDFLFRIPRLMAGEKKFECEKCIFTTKIEKHLAIHLIKQHKIITVNLISDQVYLFSVIFYIGKI